MPIQFACPFCERVSSVPSSFAGKKGKCPSCQKVIEVPGDEPEPDPAEKTVPPPGTDEPAEVDDAVRGSDAGPAPRPSGNRDCPYCGETVKAVAKKCRYCGEFFDKNLRRERHSQPRKGFGPFTVGGAVQRGWDTTMANVGPCIAACVIFLGVMMGIGFATGILQEVVTQSSGDPVMVFGVQILDQILTTIAQTFLTLGLCKFGMDMLRGRKAQIGDVFGGGRWFIQGLLAQILLYIFMAVLMIPGVIVGLVAGFATEDPVIGILAGTLIVFPPLIWLGVKTVFTMWAIVDGDLDCISAIKASFKLTSGHGWNVFLLLILVGLITMLGVLAFCVGLLFAYPVAWLAIGTAYLSLSRGGLDRHGVAADPI